VTISRDTVPFLITVGFTLAQVFSGYILSKRFVDLYRDLNTRKGIVKPEDELPEHLQPETLGRLVDWLTDTSQALGAIATPLLGWLVLIQDKLKNWLSLCYIGAVLVAFVAWALLVGTDRPDKYVKRRVLKMTLVTVAIIAVNLACAILVQFLPPPADANS